MDYRVAIAIAAVIVAAAVVVWVMRSRRRSRQLRQRFGPEYDRVASKQGDPKAAEKVLEMRAKRVDKLELRPLAREEALHFSEQWTRVQARFVDDPPGAVSEADWLVTEVMRARGYPMSNFEERAADISVDHPVVVENYRAAHQIAMRHGRGEASTEDLRNALVHYRSLFNELLETREPVRREARG
jgi:hypothetical protein